MNSLNNIDSYCLKPSASNTQQYYLYQLAAYPTYKLNSFVLLPYRNPQKEQTRQLFFDIIHQNKIEIGPKANGLRNKILLKAKTPKETYLKNLVGLKQHIQNGNIYEINYCIEFYADDVEIDPIETFIHLNTISKAPYASLVKLKDDFIIGASPELFLKKEGDILFTKPIKGTSKRGNNKIEDELLKDNLFNSLKERTENVMAVDVARNDLSRIAQKGTVSVNKLYNIESYETVHQMVSTVSCNIKETTNFNHIVEATFPMASMTGAPKIMAMQLIDEHENFERNFYSGAMGIIDEKGDFTLSVNIRSIFYNQVTKRLSIAVGSAITYLCDPAKEYSECLLKAEGLLKALNAEIFDE